MVIHKTKLPGLIIIEPDIYQDERGFLLPFFCESKYREHGFNKPFVLDNLSRSHRNVLRGLHYQLEKPQGKLVSIVRGSVFDVAVDIRKGSPTFGQWHGIELNDQNHLQIYIPEGFAHGFCVLSEEADFFYKCTDGYHPQSEQGILWNDPTLAINWQISNPILSPKDKENKLLSEMSEQLLPRY
jgi:dTDP-4-dehydrorhamnose 3,5-epimerase